MSSKKKSVNLKQLWLEKKKEKLARIAAPHAKYNSLGRLSCSLCNVPVKDETLWKTHLLSKQHKQNLANQTSQKPHVPAQPKPLPPNTAPPTQKRSLPPGFIDEAEPKAKVKKQEEAQLPPGVSAMLSQIEAAEEEVEEMDTADAAKEDKTSKLPEGFFDDPKQDAHARGKEYKDPMDEAWEQFQKEMNMEKMVSEDIADHEAEESENVRSIEDIDEQIVEWSKYVELEKLREANKKVKTEPESEPSSEKEDDSAGSGDSDVEDLTSLHWRAKGFVR